MLLVIYLLSFASLSCTGVLLPDGLQRNQSVSRRELLPDGVGHVLRLPGGLLLPVLLVHVHKLPERAILRSQ